MDTYLQNDSAYGPFEGPEKLLEVWFAPSPDLLADASATPDGKFGLRKVPKAVWEEMLDIVRCKILSHVEGAEMDAYLLRCVLFFALVFDGPVSIGVSLWPIACTSTFDGLPRC